MTETQNPLFPAEAAKFLTEFRWPVTGFDGILDIQRRNIEALTRANHLAVEGMQAVARRQVEVLRGGAEELAILLKLILAANTPGERFGHQAEAAKKALTSAVANARELVEILTKSRYEAVDVLSGRFNETLDELSALVAKAGA